MNRFFRTLAMCLLGCAWALAGCSSDEEPDPPIACGDGMEKCDDGVCRDIMRDPAHCGACGAACGEWEACNDGECVFACPAGREDCSGSCVDLASDSAHCGACGEACGKGEHCLEGACVPECGEKETLCEGACVDLDSNAAHCGACGRPCDDGLSCREGVCLLLCEGDQAVCGGTCVDLASDAANCGQCGNACDSSEICEDKVCTCPEGKENCGLGCIDVTEDVFNCGACNLWCEAGPNTTGPACEDSQCVAACKPGFADCDGDLSNGCETFVDADAANCGACDASCYTDHVEDAACVESTCVIGSCEAGWGNCDGDAVSGAASGCETELLSNPLHCGACNNNCFTLPGTTQGASCDAGVCQFTCADGFHDCDGDPLNGCEITDLVFEDSVEHCGACNIACGGGESCVAGVCTPDYQMANWPLPPDGPTDYTDNGDGTITDNVTGLVWQQAEAASAMNWSDALAHCESLAPVEGSAWRLPTMKELSSIVDNTQAMADPKINPAYFPDTPKAMFWSATPGAVAPTQAWVIDFQNGLITLSTMTNENRVRCVRAGKWEAGERHVVTADTVEDTKTGLVWQRELDLTQDADLNYPDAVARCADLSLAGKSDWRIPSQKELESILDRRLNDPAIDTTLFPDTPSVKFWTSTQYMPGQNFFLDFLAGTNSPITTGDMMGGKEQGVHVRCVRTAD